MRAVHLRGNIYRVLQATRQFQRFSLWVKRQCVAILVATNQFAEERNIYYLNLRLKLEQKLKTCISQSSLFLSKRQNLLI